MRHYPIFSLNYIGKDKLFKLQFLSFSKLAIYLYFALFLLKRGDFMKAPVAWIVVMVFAAVLGIGLLGGGLTGHASGGIPSSNGTVLSVLAAILAIGVLIVAGLQTGK